MMKNIIVKKCLWGLRSRSGTPLCLLGWMMCLVALLMPVSAWAKHDYKLHKNVTWVELEDISLSLDIYVPNTGKTSYPVIIIYHGGGWLINTNSIMDSMSAYLASHGNYVVANVNYRRLGDQQNRVTLNKIVEDAFGALAWVKENITAYGGDPQRIAVTGDSAGGHLASMVVLQGRRLESDGFSGPTLGFNPTYLPRGETAESLAQRDGLRVQAAVISYAVFDLHKTALSGFETAQNGLWAMVNAKPRGIFGENITAIKHPEWYYAVSPLYHIPPASTYRLPPQFVHVGSADTTTPPSSSQAYVDALKAAGQPVEFRIYPQRNHAYLDNGCNDYLKVCFDRDAIAPLQDMLQFLNDIFWATTSSP